MHRILKRFGKQTMRLVPDDALNAETPLRDLGGTVTPLTSFFVRNNGDLPSEAICDASKWVIALDGEMDNPQSLTLPQLRTEFENVSLTAVLECAGNGRNEYTPRVDGLAWGRGAVGCAVWRGVRLRDVLQRCGVRPDAVYTAHYSPDRKIGSRADALSRGLPIEKALAPETLLAFEMNGEPLPYLHGGPLRVVAPGWPGSAWQKWLSRLWVRDRVHDGEKMTGTDYRLPNVPLKPGDESGATEFRIIEAMPVNSVITSPTRGSDLAPGGMLTVEGKAWSGQGRVVGVDVSFDGGESWIGADLDDSDDLYAWSTFVARKSGLSGSAVDVLARARDDAGGVQPLHPHWNPRGYCNNATHRISLTIKG